MGEDRGVWIPYPRGWTPLPPPSFLLPTPAPFFSLFFSGTPAPNSDFLPAPPSHLTPAHSSSKAPKQSTILSCCHSPLACWKSSSTSVLPHNFIGTDWGSLIRGRNGSEWLVNLMVIGIALGFWQVLFYDMEQVGNIDGEQHRVKARSLWYSSRQPFLFWKSSFNFYLLIFLRYIWREPFPKRYYGQLSRMLR